MQGGSVARTFLQLPGWHVRGITRNPSGAAAEALTTEGVEIVQGDLDDKQSLVKAFKGANVIFSNTDFFAHFFYAMKPEAKLPAGRSAGKHAYEREVEQGVNIAEAAESPSVLKTLERFVMSSLSDATKWSGGKYTSLYHFDSKAEMLRVTRERCPGVASKMSTLQLGHYVNNWKNLAKLGPQKQSDGSYIMTRTSPPSFKMPFVVAEQDTGPFVKVLVDMPAGKDAVAVSEYMTFPEWAEIWGRVHGVKIQYKQVSNEELFEGIPDDFMREIRDGFDYINDFGFTGGDPDVLEPSQVSTTSAHILYHLLIASQLEYKVPVTTMEEYIKNEDWSSILST